MKRGITHVPELESYREGVSGEVVNTYNWVRWSVTMTIKKERHAIEILTWGVSDLWTGSLIYLDDPVDPSVCSVAVISDTWLTGIGSSYTEVRLYEVRVANVVGYLMDTRTSQLERDLQDAQRNGFGDLTTHYYFGAVDNCWYRRKEKICIITKIKL